MAVTVLDHPRVVKTRQELRSNLRKQPPLKALSHKVH